MHITDRTEAPWRAVRPVSNASLVQLQSQRQVPALQHPEAIVRSTSRPLILADRVWGTSSPAASSSNAASVTGTRAIDRLALLRLESRQSSTATTTLPTKTELYKTELCRSWSQTQSCPYGSKCQFAHGSDELRPVQRHPKYKTVECNQWAATGKCTFGNRCVFIHDKIERQGPNPATSAGRSDVSSWIVSDNATPYVAPTANAPSIATLSKRFSRVMVESSNDEDDLIKRIQSSFPMFGELLKKPAPVSQQQQDDQGMKVTTRTL